MVLYQLLALVVIAQQAPTLADLEKRAQVLNAERNWSAAIDKQRGELNRDLIKLIDTNSLSTGEEFFRATNVVMLGRMGFLESRMSYELMVTAMALGHEEAAKRIKRNWDFFLMSTGRRQHFGSVKGAPGMNEDKYEVQPTVDSVRTVLDDPVKARIEAAKLKPNAEIATLVAEDQKVRQSDWTKLTPAQMMEISKADEQRRARLKTMLKGIKLMTAQDYQDAALVMQHGSWFDDYALAHELSLCSTILDPKVGRQMVALSYDRMLVSAGYKQRIATQYHGVALTEVDSEGFSDAMRKALGRRPLAEVPKTFGGG